MPDWTDVKTQPPREAFWVENVVDTTSRKPVVGMVRHVGQAFVATARAGTRTSAALPDTVYQDIAYRYLVALDVALGPMLGLDRSVLGALSGASTSHCFGWLRIGWGDRAVPGARDPYASDPYASFWLTRQQNGQVADCTLVLLAGRRLHGLSMGGDIGLRLALHVHGPDAQGLLRVHIFGVTLCNLHRALAPLPKRFEDGPADKRLALAEKLLLDLNEEISKKLGFEPGSLVHSVRPVGDDKEGLLRVEGRGVKRRQVSGGPPARSRVFSFTVDVDALQQIRHVRTLAIAELASSAHGPVADSQVRSGLTVFERDPASCGPAATLAERRPTRDDAQLNGWRVNLDHRLLDPQRQETLTLIDKEQRFQVQGPKARVGQASTMATTGGAVVQINRRVRLALRSDETAAAQAHVRAYELFDRLAAYGLDAASYFRHARLPLVLRTRSAMRGAPDGDAINAEVRPFWGGGDFPRQQTLNAKRPPFERPQLLVKFASADPAHRKTLGLRDDPQRERAQYLGIACDPRWAWHEFGHVLNFASTGELEFAFAHSAGDALAAIATDPDSALAWDDEARYMTFPWVQVARRHDRSVLTGYCWCGARNRLRLATDRPSSRHRHGYFEEQLLSSSLFRLYRCLGGDTRAGTRPPPEPRSRTAPEDDDTQIRREASDFCLYLIMRAISLLGPDSVAPARTPDQFVSALIDADLGTGDWSVNARWPFRRDHVRELRRRGGRVHKVIRWAFEQQGLYATDDPLATDERVGLAPPVDLFIADQRSARCDGGYHPVPLRTAGAPGTRWRAHPDWLWRDGADLMLRVGNRGRQPATGVTAQVWLRPDGDASAPWKALGAALAISPSLAPTPAGTMPPPHRIALPPGPYNTALWVLVSVDSAADASHLTPASPPPTDPAELLELVAHDNNLALRRLPADRAKGP